jgi:hypothetical protein
MSAFIRTIQGEIFGIDHNNKHFSLAIEETLDGVAQKKKIDFLLGPNVEIIDISNQLIKLISLKKDQKVQVGYTRDKSKRTAVYIKVIS